MEREKVVAELKSTANADNVRGMPPLAVHDEKTEDFRFLSFFPFIRAGALDETK